MNLCDNFARRSTQQVKAPMHVTLYFGTAPCQRDRHKTDTVTISASPTRIWNSDWHMHYIAYFASIDGWLDWNRLNQLFAVERDSSQFHKRLRHQQQHLLQDVRIDFGNTTQKKERSNKNKVVRGSAEHVYHRFCRASGCDVR